MKITSQKVENRKRRHARIRAKVKGTATCPRLAVYRSNRFMYAQLIDDDTSTTLVGLDTRVAKAATAKDRAKEVGLLIADEAKKKGILKVVFDRGGFQYQGAVVSLAEGAREGGLEF
ncbi:MAG: 50S ribosomal protein L18 [Candidatus Pacebacteria bacterium]|nr:50S ribosomal protein L18 [Candidatus Paceibacterota bacterium]MCF7857412.1 50S ribosomal protein L18 [Candidatus Paceibacterota bacterium]